MNYKLIAELCLNETKFTGLVISTTEDFDKIVEEILELTSADRIHGLDPDEIVLDQKKFRRVYSFLVHNCTIDIKNE